MCGIAGLIHRKKTGDIGTEMTKMLVSLKHRGPDSTGFALYGKPKGNELVLRFKVAEQEDMAKGFDIHQQVKDRRSEVDRRLKELGAFFPKEAAQFLHDGAPRSVLTEHAASDRDGDD